MKKILRSILLSSVLLSCPLMAANSAADKLAISASATYDLVQANPKAVLFVDVRDPVEIMFIGFTDTVDQNIP